MRCAATAALLLSLPGFSAAGRMEYLQKTDVNKDFSKSHHQPQPRYTRCPFANASAGEEEHDCDKKIVAGPTTPAQRRKGWVWVKESSAGKAQPSTVPKMSEGAQSDLL